MEKEEEIKEQIRQDTIIWNKSSEKITQSVDNIITEFNKISQIKARQMRMMGIKEGSLKWQLGNLNTLEAFNFRTRLRRNNWKDLKKVWERNYLYGIFQFTLAIIIIKLKYLRENIIYELTH